MIKASLKRKLQKGVSLKMTDYIVKGVSQESNKLNYFRKIEVVQTNAIRFEGGSWLHFEEYKASDCMDIENGFELHDFSPNYKDGKEPVCILRYEFAS